MGFLQEISRNLSKLLTAAKQNSPARMREESALCALAPPCAPENMRQESPCATESRDRNDHGGDDRRVHHFDHHSDRCRGKNNGHSLFPVSIRYIAAALTAAMLFTALPAAAATPDEQSPQNTAESSAADSAYTVAPAEEAYAVSEITSMRSMNEKRFLMSDKSTMAVVYSQPVHYQNDGKWEDIDNTLVYESANSGADSGAQKSMTADGASAEKSAAVGADFNGFVNKNSAVEIKIAENAGGRTLAQISDGKYTVSWGYQGENTAADARRRTAVKAQPTSAALSFAAKKMSVSIDSLQRAQAAAQNESLEYTAAQKASQAVSFSEIESDTDLEYILSGFDLKENIIVRAKKSAYRYAFAMTAENLTAKSTADGGAEFVNDAGEVIFTVPKPYMYDANHTLCDNVELSIQPTENGGYILEITADAEWINDESRALPVVIDPVVQTQTSRNAIDTAFVTSAVPNKNYNEKAELIVGKESSEYGNCRAMAKFKLPKLQAGDMIVGATMRFGACADSNSFYASTTPNLQVNAHMITSSWNHMEVTWNKCPSFSSTVLDYDYITRQNQSYKYFDITKAAKLWYEGKNANYGILLKSYNENGSYADTGVKGQLWSERQSSDSSYAYPVITLVYRNNKGLENYWTYTSASAGTAGDVSVNDYTGNLVVVHEDVATSGLNMPISIQHVYNGYAYKSNFGEILPKMGHGWRLNIEQTVRETAYITGFNAETAKVYPFVYTDGDGTEHYFVKKEENGKTRYLDEDGLRLELKKISGKGYTIENSLDKNSSEKKIIYTFNTAGNLTQIKDSNGNSMKISYNGKTITSVTDSSGHTILIKENEQTGSGNIRSMIDPEGGITYFYFNEKGLCGIKYPDGRQSSYDYDSEGALNTLTSADGTKLKITYTSNEKGKRVASIAEYVGENEAEIAGQSVKFDRSEYNTTRITTPGTDGVMGTSDDLVTTYHFDNFGRTTDRQMRGGSWDFGAETYRYTAGALSSDKSNINQINKLGTEGALSRNTCNFAVNGGGELSSGWTSARWVNDCTYTFSYATDQKYYGAKSIKLASTAVTGDGRARIYQDFPSTVLIPGRQYTFSAYVKTSGIQVANGTDNGKNCGACLNVNTFDSGGTGTVSAYGEMITGTTSTHINNGWVRISTTVTIPTGTAHTRLNLAIRNCTGTAWFDGVQVERSGVPNNVNLLENSSFEYVTSGKPNNWTCAELTSADAAVTGNAHHDKYSMKIKGEAGKKKEIYQVVPVSGSENDTYIVSGWAKADAVCQSNDDRKFKISIDIRYSDGTRAAKSPAEFNKNVGGWQYVAQTFDLSDGTTANKTPTGVCILLRYWNEENTAYFDNVQLIKDVAQSYTYDKDGNMVSVRENAEKQSKMEYSNTDLIKETDINGKSFTYTYDDRHNMTSAKSQRNIEYKYTYNTQGNPTELTVSDQTDSIKIKTKAEYTEGGAYLKSATDENGNKTSYDYDLASGRLNSVTDSRDIKTTYTYDTARRISKVENGGASVNYTYDSKSRLSSVTSPKGTQYAFTYDAFGNALTTSVGARTLITNSYKANNNGLSRSTYGNGDYVDYLYNVFGLVGERRVNGTTKYKWEYNGNATPMMTVDYVNNLCRNYTYDSTGRLIRQKVSTRNGNTAGNDRIYGTEYSYDALNNIKTMGFIAGGRTYRAGYTYAEVDNLPSRTSLYSNRYLQLGHDTLNRLNIKTLSTDAPVYSNYTYQLSESGEEKAAGQPYNTHILQYEYIGDVVFYYGYDKAGNIIQIKKGERINKGTNNLGANNFTLVANYGYDDHNQLIREDNAFENKTVVYSYDANGNRTAVKEYDFATGAAQPQNERSSQSYSYGDAGWGDLLTSVSSGPRAGQITYDEIGNPLTYGGWNMSWTGRQLDSLSSDGTNVSYKYDADGLRTEKTVNGVTHKYYYADGKLYYEFDGKYELYFFYDHHGNLMMIKSMPLAGGEYNYYVTCNSRGDVVNLYRGDGTIKAHYEYDSWGKVLSVTDENGNPITAKDNIGHVNPIRYRGYYYDTDTGLYYLKSRYYDPELGRFVNADGYVSTGQGVLSTNMFSYCGNNPISRTDPTGKFWKELWDGVKKFVKGVAKIASTNVCAMVMIGSNYLSNQAIDKNPATTTKNKLVNDQQQVGKSFNYGLHKASHNGCEAIAVHNAKVLKGKESSLSETMMTMQSSGAMIGFGYFGSNPYALGGALTESGLSYTRVGLSDMNKAGTYIISYWNESAPWNGLHTVAVQYDGAVYTTYNIRGGTSALNPSEYASNFICGYYLG